MPRQSLAFFFFLIAQTFHHTQTSHVFIIYLLLYFWLLLRATTSISNKSEDYTYLMHNMYCQLECSFPFFALSSTNSSSTRLWTCSWRVFAMLRNMYINLCFAVIYSDAQHLIHCFRPCPVLLQNLETSLCMNASHLFILLWLDMFQAYQYRFSMMNMYRHIGNTNS